MIIRIAVILGADYVLLGSPEFHHDKTSARAVLLIAVVAVVMLGPGLLVRLFGGGRKATSKPRRRPSYAIVPVDRRKS